MEGQRVGEMGGDISFGCYPVFNHCCRCWCRHCSLLQLLPLLLLLAQLFVDSETLKKEAEEEEEGKKK